MLQKAPDTDPTFSHQLMLEGTCLSAFMEKSHSIMFNYNLNSNLNPYILISYTHKAFAWRLELRFGLSPTFTASLYWSPGK